MPTLIMDNIKPLAIIGALLVLILTVWHFRGVDDSNDQKTAIVDAQNKVITKERKDTALTNKETTDYEKYLNSIDDKWNPFIDSLQPAASNSHPAIPTSVAGDASKACTNRVSRVIQSYSKITRRADQQTAKLLKQGADQTAKLQLWQQWYAEHAQP